MSDKNILKNKNIIKIIIVFRSDTLSLAKQFRDLPESLKLQIDQIFVNRSKITLKIPNIPYLTECQLFKASFSSMSSLLL